MTELDHLRKLLDEAGVSYLNHRGDITIGYYTDDPHSVIEAMDHSLQVTGLTAEQAMRALGHSSNCTNSERTSDELGRGTCHVMTIGEFDGEGTEYYDACSNCGYEFDDDPLNYCPSCGWRIEVDG